MNLANRYPLWEQAEQPPASPVCELPAARALRSGDVCPACGQGRMDYDGLLTLRCERCGYTQGGGCYT